MDYKMLGYQILESLSPLQKALEAMMPDPVNMKEYQRITDECLQYIPRNMPWLNEIELQAEKLKPVMEVVKQNNTISEIITDNSGMTAGLEQFSTCLNEFISENRVLQALANWTKTSEQIESKLNEYRASNCDSQELFDFIEVNEQYASYGWIFIPHSIETTMKKYPKPKNKDEADQIMMKHYNETIEKIFSDIVKIDSQKSDDINIAKEAFEHKLYKPCALLLFSMIDSVLIHCQDNNTKYKENRKQGNEGIKRYENDYKPEGEKAILFLMSVKVLNGFFSKTVNFKNNNSECQLNRHLLCHGMLNKKVTKTDCYQLFLLYESMLYFTKGPDENSCQI